MYGRHFHPLAPRLVFARRLFRSLVISSLLIFAALLIGVAGYHWFGELEWVDALFNASLILGGIFPVDQLHTAAAKIFAAMYALFSGLIFVGAMGLVLSPILHRMLHKFHIDDLDRIDEGSMSRQSTQ